LKTNINHINQAYILTDVILTPWIRSNKKNTSTKPLEDGSATLELGLNSNIDKNTKKKYKKLTKSNAKSEHQAITTITNSEVFKTRAQLVYYVNEVYISGEITISMGSVSFEPDLDNCYVQKFGSALLTISFALEDIIKIEEIDDHARTDYDRRKCPEMTL